MGMRTGKFIVSSNMPEFARHPVTPAEPKRKRAALMFADIVESTELVARLGDEKWVALLSLYYKLVRRELSKFHSWYLSAAGDGFMAAFDECFHAIHCSSAIRTGAGALGLKIRIGMHAGECVTLGGFVTGLTLHIGARIAAAAAPDEMLVSACVKAQLEDRAIQFLDRGTHCLKGVPGVWRLFATCQN
jgi:class 3 adenylate cyclase